jgi:hypothetical protein
VKSPGRGVSGCAVESGARSVSPLQATEALRITAPELVKFGVMDEIIPEPLGGAHSDPMAAFPYIKEAIMKTYRECALLGTRARCVLRTWLFLSSPCEWPCSAAYGGAGVRCAFFCCFFLCFLFPRVLEGLACGQ